MTLTDIELNAIRQEAERLYPDVRSSGMPFTVNDVKLARRQSHIAAAKKERERAKGLLEALEKITMQKMLPGETDHRYAFNRNWHLAVDSLANYNESLKG